MASLTSRLSQSLQGERFPFVAAGLSVLLALPSLWMGFFADDFMQRATFVQPAALEGMFGEPFADLFTFADGDPERMKLLADRGIYPWMAHPEVLFRFWRPLTVATHWVDYQLWPDSAVLMHVHNLLWFWAMVLAVCFFYRRMMGPGLLAGLAGLLFAIDDAHAWPAAWIANRNGPLALLLCIGVLTLHDRWRREGKTPAAIASVIILGLALLAKESSISACGYLFAYALFLDKGTLRSRFLSLIPYAAVVVVWRACYVYLGYGAEGSAGYIDPARDPIQFFGVLTERVPVLLQGQWWMPPSDYYTIGPPFLQPYLVATGILGVAILTPLLVPLLRKDALARYWCAGMLLALLPIAAGGPQDRLLLFPGLGAMGLLAQFLVGFRKGELFETNPSARKWFARPAYCALVFVHLIMAPMALPGGIMALTWINNTIMAAQESFPEGPEIVGKTFVFINAANYPVGSYLFIIRGLEGRPVPAHLRSLAPVTMAVVPMTVTRPDARTLRVTPEGGYPWNLFRDANHPLEVGETVELTGMTVKVLSLAEGGWPLEVEYLFDVELEDPSLVWFLTVGVDFVESEPPGIGETVFYDPMQLLRESLENRGEV